MTDEPESTESRLPSRMVVMVQADIVKSTHLTNLKTTPIYATALKEFIARWQEIVRRNERECLPLDRGDGFAAEFRTVSNAVRTALQLQGSLLTDPILVGDDRLMVRIGIDMGEAVVVDRDVEGRNKLTGNVAIVSARLEQLALPGQILVTATVSRHAQEHLKSYLSWPNGPAQGAIELRWVDFGEYLCEGLHAPIRVVSVGASTFGILDQPPGSEKMRPAPDDAELDGRGWAKAIRETDPRARRAKDPAVPLEGANPNNSPYIGPRPFNRLESSRLFGREEHVRAMFQLLARHRVLLLTGRSGIGKSSFLNTRVASVLGRAGYHCDISRVGLTMPDQHAADRKEPRNIFTASVIVGCGGDVTVACTRTLADWLKHFPMLSHRGRVLIIDQFEELLTRHAGSEAQRMDFLVEVTEALRADPKLLVILASRNEYVKDLKSLLCVLPPDIAVDEFELPRLSAEGVRESIKEPAAGLVRFDPTALDRIVSELQRPALRARQYRTDELATVPVELLQLQIVCDRLWRSFPKGATSITLKELNLAAGGDFRSLILSAVNDYFKWTVDTVTSSSKTQNDGGYPADLVRFGCTFFVSEIGVRRLVHHEVTRVGCLPVWIVDQLVDLGLLRREQRGDELWCELSHDLLVSIVQQGRDEKTAQLLLNYEALCTRMHQAARKDGTGYTEWFGEDKKLLNDCKAFAEKRRLLDSEQVEFLMRVGLASGQDADVWLTELLAQEGDNSRACAVLLDAMKSERPTVRANAATLYGDVVRGEQSPMPMCESVNDALLQQAVADADRSVRRAASHAIAKVDDPEMAIRLVAAREVDEQRQHATEGLARIRIDAELRGSRSFGQLSRKLSALARLHVRMVGYRIRLVEGWAEIALVCVIGMVCSAVGGAAFKWLPGLFGWALCQANAGFLMGMFHGAVAGAAWGFCISLMISLHRVVASTQRTRSAFYSTAFGALGGCISGVLVSAIVLGVYEIISLYTMGWIKALPLESLPTEVMNSTPSDVIAASNLLPAKFSSDFLKYVFVDTRMAIAYPITGSFLGAGVAISAWLLCRKSDWEASLHAPRKLEDTRAVMELFIASARLVLSRQWHWILTALLIASVIVFYVVNPDSSVYEVPPNSSERFKNAAQSLPKERTFSGAQSLDVALGVFADCGSQVVGGITTLIGVMFARAVVKRGVELKPRQTGL